jgi:sugar transferase (PEP-CTERM system associated)
MEICCIAVGLYNEKLRCGVREIASRILVSVILSYCTVASIYAITPLDKNPLLVLESIYFIIILGLFATRSALLLSDKKYIKKTKVLVLGAGKRASLINSSMKRKTDRLNFDLKGYVSLPGDASDIDNTQPRVFITENQLGDYCKNYDIEELVIAADERRGTLPSQELLECKADGVYVTDIIDFIERETGQIAIEHINPSWAIFNHSPVKLSLSFVLNNVFNILLSLFIFLATWPFILLTIAAIKIEDGLFAPVIYKQQRIGLNGRRFDIYKFRSMKIDAEKDGAKMTTKTDDRVTKVGRVIRKYRLDELPQLFNVVRGDMCFVGPRPERPEFTSNFSEDIPYYNQRNYVKPGLTGWAQLKYPYGENSKDAAEKLKFDLYYIKHRSFLLDLLILVRTSEVVLFGKGR